MLRHALTRKIIGAIRAQIKESVFLLGSDQCRGTDKKGIWHYMAERLAKDAIEKSTAFAAVFATLGKIRMFQEQ